MALFQLLCDCLIQKILKRRTGKRKESQKGFTCFKNGIYSVFFVKLSWGNCAKLNDFSDWLESRRSITVIGETILSLSRWVGNQKLEKPRRND